MITTNITIPKDANVAMISFISRFSISLIVLNNVTLESNALG
jgi:hypothetical protein